MESKSSRLLHLASKKQILRAKDVFNLGIPRNYLKAGCIMAFRLRKTNLELVLAVPRFRSRTKIPRSRYVPVKCNFAVSCVLSG